jgi:hypothetical protein
LELKSKLLISFVPKKINNGRTFNIWLATYYYGLKLRTNVLTALLPLYFTFISFKDSFLQFDIAGKVFNELLVPFYISANVK